MFQGHWITYLHQRFVCKMQFHYILKRKIISKLKYIIEQLRENCLICPYISQSSPMKYSFSSFFLDSFDWSLYFSFLVLRHLFDGWKHRFTITIAKKYKKIMPKKANGKENERKNWTILQKFLLVRGIRMSTRN